MASLRGPRGLLSRPDRPAILFEQNPITLRESGVSVRALRDLLPGYRLHYVDDLHVQKILFGEPIQEADEIDWICNLFAVPLAESSSKRMMYVLGQLRNSRRRRRPRAGRNDPRTSSPCCSNADIAASRAVSRDHETELIDFDARIRFQSPNQ